MRRYITIIALLVISQGHGQTVHTVKVAIGQGKGCPVVTSTDHTHPMTVYPNPATSTFSIRSVAPGTQFRMINMQGRVVMKSKLISDQRMIDISQVPRGVYLIQLFNEKESEILKIIVQ